MHPEGCGGQLLQFERLVGAIHWAFVNYSMVYSERGNVVVGREDI